jgi:hypothetical protein
MVSTDQTWIWKSGSILTVFKKLIRLQLYYVYYAVQISNKVMTPEMALPWMMSWQNSS